MTIVMTHVFLTDTRGTYCSSRDGNIYSKSKTKQNMSEYRLNYLFQVRRRCYEGPPHYLINFLSYLS